MARERAKFRIGWLEIVETVGFFEKKVSKLAQGLLRA